MTADPEIVVRAGVEGGCVTLYRARTSAGAWAYFRELNQVMLCEMVEDMDGSMPDAPTKVGSSVATFEEGLALLDVDPWARFYPADVHPEYADRVFAAVMQRVGRLPLRDRPHSHVISRWREQCGQVRDDDA
jgi:hypothetical protein